MSWWIACLWGAMGAIAMESFELSVTLRNNLRFPWRITGEGGPLPYLVAAEVRIIIGALTSLALSSSMHATPVTLALVGASAPVIISRLSRLTEIRRETNEEHRPVSTETIAAGESKSPHTTDTSPILTELIRSLPSEVSERVRSELARSLSGIRADLKKVIALNGAVLNSTPEASRVPTESFGSLIGEIAHSLGTPITQIEATALLMRDGEQDDNFAADILASVEICKVFLEGFREIASVAPSVADDSASIRSSLERAAGIYRSKNPSFEGIIRIETPNQVPGYSCSYIVAVLLPILENALELSVSSGSIEVGFESDSASQRFLVSSEPTSLPVSDAIFERGYSTQEGHTGLGLVSVQRLLSVQRGTSVRFECKDNRVTFIVELPIGYEDVG